MTLELCSGTGSFSKVAKLLGYETITVDNNPKFKPTLCCDVRNLNTKMFENRVHMSCSDGRHEGEGEGEASRQPPQLSPFNYVE